MVCPDWDLRLINEFTDDQLIMIGTQYEKYNGFSSGNSNIQQYKGKPTLTWLAFRHGFIPIGLSALPSKDFTLPINDDLSSRIYGLPVGFQLLRDTGWEIPQFIHKNNLKFQVLENVKPSSSNAKVLKGLSPYHDEFHLGKDPFLVHQRGSMTHLFYKDPLSKDFYAAILEYFDNAKWAKDSCKRNILSEVIILTKRTFLKILRWSYGSIYTNRCKKARVQ